jgi:endonuclease/exonuclease/phosphatase family metal-dependent hydrolase
MPSRFLSALHGVALAALLAAGVGACATARVALAPGEGSHCMNAISPAGTAADVAWLTPARPDRGRGLEAWCAGVGPAVLESAGPVTMPGLRADSLFIVSWNVHVGGGDLVRMVRDLRAGLLTTGRPVEDFVLLLQEGYRAGPEVPRSERGAAAADRIAETPPSGKRLDVVEAARRLGLHLFYAPSMRNGEGDEDRGNAILSTLPLSGATAIELPLEAQRRVAVAGTVSGLTRAGRPWSLRVASVHLAHRAPWSRIVDSFGAARAHQARVVAQELEGDAVVVGADLNSWSTSDMEDAPRVLRSSFPDGPREEEPTFTLGGFLPRKLDYLMFRLPEPYVGDVRRIDDRYGSDHYPLLGMVRFEG